MSGLGREEGTQFGDTGTATVHGMSSQKDGTRLMPESCVKAKEEMEKSCISAQLLLLYGYKKCAPREHDQEERRRQLINLRSDFRTP